MRVCHKSERLREKSFGKVYNIYQSLLILQIFHHKMSLRVYILVAFSSAKGIYRCGSSYKKFLHSQLMPANLY